MKNDKNAEPVLSEAEGADTKREQNAEVMLEIANAYQAYTKLKSIYRALRGFSVEVSDACELGIEAERELDILIDWLERSEDQLVDALDGLRRHLGVDVYDLPAAQKEAD